MKNIHIQAEQSAVYALYPVREIKSLYTIKAEYKHLLIQLDQLHNENLALKQQLSRYQSQIN